MAVVTALVAGLALGGAAAWSFQAVLIAHHIQSDLCIIDRQQGRELADALGEPTAPSARIPGCP